MLRNPQKPRFLKKSSKTAFSWNWVVQRGDVIADAASAFQSFGSGAQDGERTHPESMTLEVMDKRGHNSLNNISVFFSRMRSEGSRFTWGSGGEAVVAKSCVCDRNRSQPFATVGNRLREGRKALHSGECIGSGPESVSS